MTKKVYRQQRYSHENIATSMNHRIENAHQSHVRPIFRGKANAKTKFGAKVNMGLKNGYAFNDVLSCEAINERRYLGQADLDYTRRFCNYPEEVLADKIYCHRNNRAFFKTLEIMLIAKPLGRSKVVDVEHIELGERKPTRSICLFGQAKTWFDVNRNKTRLNQTSESWIATIILVLNRVKLVGSIAYTFNFELFDFSAMHIRIFLNNLIGRTNRSMSYKYNAELFQQTLYSTLHKF